MHNDLTLVSAFLVGFLGSTHCLGMCSGIVSALSLGVRADLRQTPRSLGLYLVAYNSGRIGSYVLAGALAGALGSGALGVLPLPVAAWVMKVIGGGFMIALGLYLAGWWPGLQVLEQWGGHLWRHLEPLGRQWLPVNHPLKALAIGLLWGWLPCGMVYAMLAWALTAGSSQQGATLMLAFGLGTLPMLLAIGATAGWLKQTVRRSWVRRAAGIAVLCLGLYTLLVPASPTHHHVSVQQLEHESPAGQPDG